LQATCCAYDIGFFSISARKAAPAALFSSGVVAFAIENIVSYKNNGDNWNNLSMNFSHDFALCLRKDDSLPKKPAFAF